MDMYFIVGELSFPPGAAARWRASPIPRTKRHPEGTTLDAVLASAEGPVRLDVRGDAVSLRVFLIDSAYFMVKDELEAALGLAKGLGARGQWYSGDHVSGQHAVLPSEATRVKLHALPDVSAWTAEAVALDEPVAPPSDASAPRAATAPGKKPAKKPAKKLR